MTKKNGIIALLLIMLLSVLPFSIISADEPGEIEVKTRYSCPLGRNEHSYYKVTDVFLPEGWVLDNYWIEEEGWATCGGGADGHYEYPCMIYIVYDPLLGGYEDAPYGDYQDRCMNIETLDIEHVYQAQGAGGKNLWEVHHPELAFKGYCFSHHTGAPGGTYDRVEGTDRNFVQGGIIDNISTATTEPASSNRSFSEAFKTALYFGYPNDGGGIKAKYNLSDTEFTIITHNVIWHYSNGHDYDSLVAQVEEMCNNGYFGGVTGNWDYRVLNAFNELYYKTYNDIPKADRDKMKLYIYISRDGAQNLMSMESIQYDERGGVTIYKVDNENKPVSGAVFGIYNSSNQLVHTLTTESHGVGLGCKTDHFDGLPLGTYTVKEITAPNGYTKSNDYFTFTISQQNEIATQGKKNGGNDLELMKFVNAKNTEAIKNYGGLKIKKTDTEGNPLAGAVYGIYNSSNNKVLELVTNGKGEAETSQTALERGNYTLKEITAPDGYDKDDNTYPFTIAGNQQFVSITDLKNKKQDIFVDIKVKKEFLKEDKEGNTTALDLDREFTFQLFHVEGKNPTTGERILTPIAEENVDANGEVLFKNVKQLQVGVDTFLIKEKTPSSCTNVLYDEKEVIAEVMNVNGQGFVMFENVDEGGVPIFRNYLKQQDLSGRVWLDANIDGIQDNDESPLENIEVCLFRTTKGDSNDTATTISGITLYPARDPKGNLIECQRTNANGEYSFTDLDVATYYVVSQIGEKTVVTLKDVGNDSKDNDAEKANEYAIIKNINANDYCSWETYREFPHNDIGIILTPEKFIYDTEYNDINNQIVNQGEDIIYVIKFDNPFNYSKTFTFEDILPEGTTFVSHKPINFLTGGAESTDVQYDESTRKITWTANNVEANSQMEMEFTVNATVAKNHPVNEGSVTFDNTTLWTNKVEAWVPKLIVRKLGPKNENEVLLAGAEIEVREVSSGKVINSWVTDGETDHYIKNLKFDVDYEVVEVKAPEGYVRENLATHKFKLVKWEASATE